MLPVFFDTYRPKIACVGLAHAHGFIGSSFCLYFFNAGGSVSQNSIAI